MLLSLSPFISALLLVCERESEKACKYIDSGRNPIMWNNKIRTRIHTLFFLALLSFSQRLRISGGERSRVGGSVFSVINAVVVVLITVMRE